MRNHGDLKPEDLVEDPAFRAWIYHGTGDAAWKEWLGTHPDRLQAAELARHVLLSIRGEQDHLPGTRVQNRVQEMLSQLNTSEPDYAMRPSNRYFPKSKWLSVAAGLILVAGLGALLYPGPDDSSKEENATAVRLPEKSGLRYTEVSSGPENQKLVNLPDGSSVLLGKSSGIRFPVQFSPEKREVELTGEAFFEVKKNPGHPFFVYAGKMVARVIGTSFTITAYENDAVAKVRVKTGKVSVSHLDTDASGLNESPAGGLVLEPNQQAEFSRSDLKIVLLENPKNAHPPTPIESLDFGFRRTAVSEVFELIKKVYHVDIQYDAGLLQHCSVTASLGDEPLMEKLNMICEVIDATYRVENEKIYIKANGCE